MSSIFESMTGKLDYVFPEYDSLTNDPIGLGRKWLQEAINEDVREPNAMVLVTANLSGNMSSRVMAILEFTNEGIVFATHSCSRKIKDVKDNPFACGHFYWRELGRQLSISGKVKALTRERAIEEWNKRAIPLHPMSTVSYQSEPLISNKQLLISAQKLDGTGALPCPSRYTVYLLEPHAIEFWSASSNRLHKRLRFEHTQNGWESLRLQP
ncbi:pyridoxal 5'-phosphate synthase [Xenorhabdus anantnagensis]|uniref:Pyridoxal 5'-phosphate synthase n=1 Tax=Xenorhabdus anantnagensis TaxID=3025875 RepID=A0ABT5LQN0_9GAMM|nr:pyridoxal 5'-phosphate synthase [Xenorhabdus anantnagensis]MDC9595355.1 pyridoxal 5'-phosphate synthase [Xenorhabdus anantnagensis]